MGPIDLGFYYNHSFVLILLFKSTVLLIYSLLWLLVLNLIVVFIEEPRLRRRFGESYDKVP